MTQFNAALSNWPFLLPDERATVKVKCLGVRCFEGRFCRHFAVQNIKITAVGGRLIAWATKLGWYGS